MSTPKIENKKQNKKNKKSTGQKEYSIFDSVLLNQYYIIY